MRKKYIYNRIDSIVEDKQDALNKFFKLTHIPDSLKIKTVVIVNRRNDLLYYVIFKLKIKLWEREREGGEERGERERENRIIIFIGNHK